MCYEIEIKNFALYCDNDGLIKELQQGTDSAEDTGLVVFLCYYFYGKGMLA